MCLIFRKEFDIAIKQVEDKLGIKVSLSNMTINFSDVSCKLTFATKREVDFLKLTYEQWKGLQFKHGDKILTVTEKHFDDSVIMVFKPW